MNKSFTSTQREPAAYKPCPSCKGSIGYYWFSGMGELFPHFYCDRCSNVFFDPKIKKNIYYKESTNALVEEIDKSLPHCPCGGQFKSGQNPKCPKCGFEFKHQSNPIQRLTDPYLILIEGAFLLEPADSST